jgi:para-nitrobenzyl esterase
MTQAAKLYESIYFDPIAGTPSLPVSVSDQFTEGTVHKVELLIGSNADEWLIYLDESHSFEDDLNELAPPEQHEAIRQALAGLPERKARDILISAANYVCPSFRIAETMTLLDRQVWFYYFDQVRTGELASTMGAYHGAELPYVFDTHDDWLPTTAADRALTDVMMSYWSNFIKTGDPNAPGLPRWAPYDGESQLTLRLNTKAASQAHPSASICAALDM